MGELPRGTLDGPADAGNRAIAERNEALRSEIWRLRNGTGDGRSFVHALRSSVVYALPVQGRPDALTCAEQAGLMWLLAFTSASELARYVVAHGTESSEPVDYVTVLGARLVDAGLPRLRAQADMPVGLAVDVAGAEPMLASEESLTYRTVVAPDGDRERGDDD